MSGNPLRFVDGEVGYVLPMSTGPSDGLKSFVEKHPMIALIVAILILPVTFAAADYYGYAYLAERGNRRLAISVLALGVIVAVGAAVWFATSPTGSDRPDDQPRAEGNNMGYVDYDACRDAGHGRWDCLFGTG